MQWRLLYILLEIKNTASIVEQCPNAVRFEDDIESLILVVEITRQAKFRTAECGLAGPRTDNNPPGYS